MNDEPQLALSIRQPWAWLIVNIVDGCWKDVENRNWPTDVRGSVFIHAAKGMTRQEYFDAKTFAIFRCGFPMMKFPAFEALERGGIIGKANLWNCAKTAPTGRYGCMFGPSPWFVGRFGFWMKNPVKLPFRPCKGALGFFTPE